MQAAEWKKTTPRPSLTSDCPGNKQQQLDPSGNHFLSTQPANMSLLLSSQHTWVSAHLGLPAPQPGVGVSAHCSLLLPCFTGYKQQHLFHCTRAGGLPAPTPGVQEKYTYRQKHPDVYKTQDSRITLCISALTFTWSSLCTSNWVARTWLHRWGHTALYMGLLSFSVFITTDDSGINSRLR